LGSKTDGKKKKGRTCVVWRQSEGNAYDISKKREKKKRKNKKKERDLYLRGVLYFQKEKREEKSSEKGTSGRRWVTLRILAKGCGDIPSKGERSRKRKANMTARGNSFFLSWGGRKDITTKVKGKGQVPLG